MTSHRRGVFSALTVEICERLGKTPPIARLVQKYADVGKMSHQQTKTAWRKRKYADVSGKQTKIAEPE
jgi:ribosomal protein L11